jgi:ferritin-like metal-binding protein YciE
MTIKNPKEVFVALLSNAMHGTEREAKVYQELNQLVQDESIKEALDARIFMSDKVQSTLEQCFKLIGEQPVKPNLHLLDVFMEDFRREIAEIQSPAAKHLFVLAKLQHLAHLRLGEYTALIAAADVTGNYGVGVLLESCMAIKLAFIERTRRLIKNVIENKMAKLAA